MDRFNKNYFSEPQSIVFVFEGEYFVADFLKWSFYGRCRDNHAPIGNEQKQLAFKLDDLYADFNNHAGFRPMNGFSIGKNLIPSEFFPKMIEFVSQIELTEKYLDFRYIPNQPIFNVKSLSKHFEVDFLLLPEDAELKPVSLISVERNYSNWSY